MSTTPTTKKASAASKSAASTINPVTIAKIGACLDAINRNQTAEDFINESLLDMLNPSGGFFEGLIEDEDEPQRATIEAKLAEIYASEPKEENITVVIYLSAKEFEAIGTAALREKMTLTDYAVKRAELVADGKGLPEGKLQQLNPSAEQNLVFKIRCSAWRKAWDLAQVHEIDVNEFFRRMMIETDIEP